MATTRRLPHSQHSFGAEYACGVTSGVWAHFLLTTPNLDKIQPERIDELLTNWLDIAVYYYLYSRELAKFRHAFQNGVTVQNDVPLLHDSLKIAGEENGILTHDEAVAERAYGTSGIYLTLPQACDRMLKIAKTEGRAAAIFTGGKGFSSCICIRADEQAYFVDSHWNNPVNGGHVNGMCDEELRKMHASSIWATMRGVAALAKYLSHVYRFDSTAAAEGHNLFHVTYLIRQPEWNRSVRDKYLPSVDAIQRCKNQRLLAQYQERLRSRGRDFISALQAESSNDASASSFLSV